MAVQFSYPERYVSSTYFNDVYQVVFLNQTNSLFSGYVAPTSIFEFNNTGLYRDNLWEIDEGTTSPNDADRLKLYGIYYDSSQYEGVNLYDIVSTPELDVYCPRVRFEYSNLLINPTSMTLRIRTDVSGFTGVLAAQCYNGETLIGQSTMHSAAIGTNTVNLTIPIAIPSHTPFKPHVNLTIGASGGTNPTVGLADIMMFSILASEIEASGRPFITTNFPMVTFGGVVTCSPVMNIMEHIPSEVVSSQADGILNYTPSPGLAFDQLKILHSGDTQYQYTNFHSFGTTWESGTPLGSHFYLREGSGRYLYSNDRKHSGEVITSLGSGTIDPIWLFNNEKIAGMKTMADPYVIDEQLHHYVGSESGIIRDGGELYSLPTFTISFPYQMASDVPSHSWIPPENDEPNAGGNTSFRFTHNSSNWSMDYGEADSVPNPYVPTIGLHPDSSAQMTALGNAIVGCFNDVEPWLSDPISVYSVTDTSVTFTVGFEASLPDNISAAMAYEHYSEGAIWGGYTDDFTWSSNAGGQAGGSGEFGVIRYGWEDDLYEYGYKNLYHNGNCLKLGVYSYQNPAQFTIDTVGSLTPSSGVYLKTFNKMPDGPYSVTVMGSDLGQNAYYLANFDRVVTSGWTASMVIKSSGEFELLHSGSLNTYPNFTQQLTVYKSGNIVDSVTSRTYNYTSFPHRFTGNIISCDVSGRYTVYNIDNYGGVHSVLSTSGIVLREPNAGGLEVRPHRMYGLRELIVTSGTLQSEAVQNYYRHNGDYLPDSNNLASFSLSSPHITHRGPDTVGAIYSGDIHYLMGDSYQVTVPTDVYTIPSGNTLKLDMIVHYSGTGDVYLHPWFEKNQFSESWTWTPLYSGIAPVQPSTVERGLRILPASGLHKVTFTGQHKSPIPTAINGSRLFMNLTYAQKTPYSGGEFNVYSAKLYSEEGICYAKYPNSGNITLYAGGMDFSSGNVPLFVYGHVESSSGLDLVLFNTQVEKTLPLYLCNQLVSTSGIPLFTYNGQSAETLPLTLFNTVTISGMPLVSWNYTPTHTSGFPLSVFATTYSGVRSNLDLYLLATDHNSNIPLVSWNTDSGTGPYSDIPLVSWNNTITFNSLPLYLESVHGHSGVLNLYSAGAGTYLGAGVFRSGIPLYIARDNDSVANSFTLAISGPRTYSGSLGLVIEGDGDLGDVDNAFGTSVLGFPTDSGLISSSTSTTSQMPFFIYGF
jgi:hypothetical protein